MAKSLYHGYLMAKYFPLGKQQQQQQQLDGLWVKP